MRSLFRLCLILCLAGLAMATPLHAQVGTTWVGGGSPNPTDFYGANWDLGSLEVGYYGYITTATGNTPVVSTNPGLTLGGVMDGFYGGTGLLTMNSGGVINTTSWFLVGFGDGADPYYGTGVLNMNGNSQVYTTGPVGIGTGWGNGTLNMTGTSNITTTAAFGIGGEVADWYGNGGWANDVGVATLGTLGGTDSPSINVGGTFMLGYLAATGTMTMNANSSLSVGAGTSYIGDYGNATLTLNDHAAATIAGGLIAGDGPGCVADVNLNNNAALTVGGDLQLGGGQWGNGFGILTATGAFEGRSWRHSVSRCCLGLLPPAPPRSALLAAAIPLASPLVLSV